MIDEINTKEDIINLWHEAFGDNKSDIEFFIENIKYAKCIGYFENNILQSMLYLIDCSYNGNACRYVYAACTYLESRGRGYMSELLDYCKQSGDFCLIPANRKLIDYYKNRGLTEVIDINNISFEQSEEIIEYLFDGCSLEKPIGLLYKGE